MSGQHSGRSGFLHAARAIMYLNSRIGLSSKQAMLARKLGRRGLYPSEIMAEIGWEGCERTLIRRLKEKNIPFGRNAARALLGVDATKLYREEPVSTLTFVPKALRSQDVA